MPQQTAVLIVDDNPADANYILELLKEAAPGRFHSVICSTISDALEVLGKQPIEVITLDLFLPDSEGLGTLLAMRARAPDIPIVVVTGYDDAKVAREAMFYGAQGYLVKNEFDADKLFETISTANVRQSQIIITMALKKAQQSMIDSIKLMRELRQAGDPAEAAPPQTSTDGVEQPPQ